MTRSRLAPPAHPTPAAPHGTPPTAPTVPTALTAPAPAGADRWRARAKEGGLAEALAGARRRVPARWVPAAVRLRLHLDRRSAAMRAEARDQVEFLIGTTGVSAGRRADVERGYLAHHAHRSELRWHDHLVTRQRVTGLEHLRDAAGRGRGVIVTFLHHGPYDGAFASVAHAGVPLHVVVASILFDPHAPPFLRQRLGLFGADGNTTVDVAVGSAGIAALLDDGACVAVALDVIGHTDVDFCGRRRRGSSGAARIAHRRGVPVVALTATAGPDGALGVSLSPVFDPAGHPDAQSLLAALLAHHEDAVLRTPEAYDRPTTRWGRLSD